MNIICPDSQCKMILNNEDLEEFFLEENSLLFNELNIFNNNKHPLEEKNNLLPSYYIKNGLKNEINEIEERKEESQFKEGELWRSQREIIEEIDKVEMICQICLDGLMEKDVFFLNTCSDIFHQECIASYAKNAIQERKNIIICPNSECKIRVNIEELKNVLSRENIETYYKYSLENYVDTHADDMSWCPTPDCKYAFYKIEGNNEYDFQCPLCNQRYCLNCRVIYHNNQTCQEYKISNSRDENDIAFDNFVQGNKFKQCPKCRYWVQKTQGCDHMVCRCKFEFCYKCGGVYKQCECKKINQLNQNPQCALF